MTPETHAEKVKKVLTMADCTQCVASKQNSTAIDVIHPNTGRTLHYGKTLAQCREEYPDAEIMTVDAWCEWKAAQQRTPITWSETTQKRFWEMLEVLPPAAGTPGFRAFLVGEPWDHDAGNGQPRFQAFRKHQGRFEVASRPMTRAEFHAECDEAGTRKVEG